MRKTELQYIAFSFEHKNWEKYVIFELKCMCIVYEKRACDCLTYCEFRVSFEFGEIEILNDDIRIMQRKTIEAKRNNMVFKL